MQEQYIKAIENSNIFTKTDPNGIITFVNDEFCTISGYTKEELLGSTHRIVRHPTVSDERFEFLWKTIKSKKIYKDTVKNMAKDGSVFYLNTTIIPILDKLGEIIEFVAIRYDVTKEMLLQDALLKKESQIEELNKSLQKRVNEQTQELQELNANLQVKIKEEIAKNQEKERIMFSQSRHASLGQMLANIAHQWRQPLTELRFILFNIKKNSADDKVSKLYDEGVELVKNMSQTIDDFANFFKPTKEQHRFCINDSVDDAISLLEHTITQEQIMIIKNMTPLEAIGVPNELTQVFINLINNSKDAFADNLIEDKIITIESYQDGSFAKITFSDNAGGIAQENLTHIFEPYFTTKHQSRGTGLGLFMSKMICEQSLGGVLDVKSDIGTTTFTIYIPLAQK